ncbi:MAG: hydrogenase expression/formation protein [Desulfuromonas sp.]|nr:MAG: hydrogenase expression/formation protein [Desulfuromonas sp.]
MTTLVLGLGNALMGDDGLGAAVISALTVGYRFPTNVRLVDGGTLGLDLLPRIEEAQRLLVIDALVMDKAPGTLVRLEGEEVPRAFASKLSLHQAGLQDLLAVAELQGHLPAQLVVHGAQGETLFPGIGLSSALKKALPQLLRNVLAELAFWGIEIESVEAEGAA